jgi:hypothetical protein
MNLLKDRIDINAFPVLNCIMSALGKQKEGKTKEGLFRPKIVPIIKEQTVVKK